jgi:hypothetical protein
MMILPIVAGSYEFSERRPDGTTVDESFVA